MDPTETLIASGNLLKDAYVSTNTVRQGDEALEENQRQFNENLNWLKNQYENTMQFANQQHTDQMDFANRNLNSNIEISNKNFNLQQAAFDYQKTLNSTQMEREDSAIQRQIADYKAAGFSPLAAIGGNGASTTALSSGSAPQYDVTGINAASGQYADLAKQYSALVMTAKSDYMKGRSQLAEKHNADRIAAKQALLQLKADMHYKNQSASTELFNAMVNYRDSLLNREYQRNQIDYLNKQKDYLYEQESYLKDKHNWEETNGYRSESWQSAFVAAFKEYLNKKSEAPTTVEKAFDVGLQTVDQASEVLTHNINKVESSVIKSIKNSGESFVNCFVGAYYECVNAGKILVSKLSDAEKKLYYAGEKVMRRIRGHKD